jgi:signal transduction histidine kinase/CheY-like chemotaxis protein
MTAMHNESPAPSNPFSSYFLSEAAPGEGEHRLAVALLALSAVSFAALLPFAKLALAPVPAFIPAYQAALALADLITAALLYGQLPKLRSHALTVLASGYLFSGAMAIVHALTFPGLLAPAGVLGGGDQTTAWLYMLWHAALPVAALGYAVLRRRPERPMVGDPGVSAACACAIVVAIVVAGTALATAGHDLLPRLMENGGYTPALYVVVGGVWTLIALAFAALWRRRHRSVLDLWLTTTMAVWWFDVGLSAVFNQGRFDLGFYAGRVYGLMAMSFVLGALLVDMSRLYSRLAAALETSETRSRELIASRQQLAAAQRLEAMGQLTGGVAHDFNNLLTVVAGAVETMTRTPRDWSKVDRWSAVALRAVARGERLTQSLLTFGRGDILRPEIVNPSRLAAELEPLLRRAVDERVEVAIQVSALVHPVHIDPAQFEIALLNLVLNARDALPKGGRIAVEVTNADLDADYVRRHADARVGSHVLVAVRDDGAGMPPAVIERAFEPFFSTKGVGKGSGLGLSQVYGFARRAGGHVTIESAVGRGSCIRIYLPKSDQRPPVVEPKPGPLPLRAAQAEETVLIVEDDPLILEATVAGVVDLGYRTLTATTAQAALAILHGSARIDLLFSDVVLPGGMDGTQLALEARRLRPSLRVLLTSGYPDRATTSMPGDLEVIGKPYRRDELATKLRLIIGGRG